MDAAKLDQIRRRRQRRQQRVIGVGRAKASGRRRERREYCAATPGLHPDWGRIGPFHHGLHSNWYRWYKRMAARRGQPIDRWWRGWLWHTVNTGCWGPVLIWDPAARPRIIGIEAQCPNCHRRYYNRV